MATRVNADVQRARILDAALRRIAHGGIAELSLRKVAGESGINVGSVRHYFDGADALLTAAAAEAAKRIEARIDGSTIERLHGLRGEAAVEALLVLIEELLPGDEQRRTETIAVLELVVASRTRAPFAAAAAQMGRDLRDTLAVALHALGAADPTGDARFLASLIAGLTLDAITPHGDFGDAAGGAPTETSTARIRAVLRPQLRRVLGVSR
ncbi:TetR family transcriptional regulator [Leucobacter luti]|uniref:TetR family transcriptional regulator n=1 Tax=Leucobacter luti TaxID=340320 RepID=A0A4R6RRI5_9MICO|nr:TetR family transcriptional regulator C-terminal domain-containing protein [Leucobacter luti]TDP89304.1 TetR family transcriptional regulator [Leucobacter luti]